MSAASSPLDVHRHPRPDVSSTLAGRLLSEGYQFNYFQAVYLAEQMHAWRSGTERDGDVFTREVRIVPSACLAFPASDVKSVEIATGTTGRAHIRVTATFMGLYGVDASLPPHFYEGIEREDASAKPLQDFLDIFNHRLYVLLYKAWRKYRPSFNRVRPNDVSAPTLTGHNDLDRDAKRFLSLAGLRNLATPRATPVPPMELAYFAGRLHGRTRNAEGLAALIQSQLKGADVAIIENIPRWVHIPVPASLGGSRGARLGIDSTIGQRIYDRAGTFRIRIGPVDLATFRSLMPGAEKARRIAWVVRVYGPDHLDYDVEVTLRSDNAQQAGLGTTGRLGLSAVLGPPRRELTRIVRYSEEGLPGLAGQNR